MTNITATVLLYKDQGVYVARCLEYDLVVQGAETIISSKLKFLDRLSKEILDNIICRLDPLSKFEQASKRFFEMAVFSEQHGPEVPLHLSISKVNSLILNHHFRVGVRFLKVINNYE